MKMSVALHETCQQYVARRLSEGWGIVWQQGYHLILSSPDGNILRPVNLRNDVETLRPNAAGSETSIPTQYPDSGYHWQKVDDVTPDEGYTVVKTAYETRHEWCRDLYRLPASSGSGTINFIKIYARCEAPSTDDLCRLSLKSDSVVTNGTAKALSMTWTTYSQQWNSNPAGGAWGSDWSVIDNLQIGISLRGTVSKYYPKCTQVYVEVDYTPVVAPTVTTQAVSDILIITATGNGNMTDNGGENASKRGVCWNTTGNPTVANDKSEEIGSFGVGAFTRPMTGLTPGQLYYVRAYAYNSAGYGYGSQVEFTTGEAPTVTTQAVSDIAPVTATGHGTITDIGGENCSKRGVCWNTTGNPTVADDK
ncbi:unnamed protein product [marine sediment metagenome]|uniref:Fibronectin type-III domain-containing protein n=1 Tax=marine sediment metagenome TaxID=412755 RepID=X1QGL0_9ZZZZ